MEITDFIKIIKDIGNKKGFENYYRGHSNKGDFKLIPSIYRDGLVDNEKDNECTIFKEAILLTPHEFLNCKSTIEKLVKMQHYGIPTRLLDITSNPLVALYFACNENKDIDGEVIFFQVPDDHNKFYDSDTVSVLSNVAKLPHFDIGNAAENTTSREIFNATSPIGELLHQIKEEKPYFQPVIDSKDLEDVFAVKVKLDNMRILKQKGAFLIFGINANKTRPTDIPPTWVLNKTNKNLKLTIPSTDKEKILADLELMGINKSTLFPEIEYQGQHLKDKYKK